MISQTFGALFCRKSFMPWHTVAAEKPAKRDKNESRRSEPLEE